MHIPDGYLSPATCALFYAGMLPVWYGASRKVEKRLKARELPFLALGAAFSFLVMMFNIPVPGGSSGHMTGAVAVAIALGPWAGVMALSLAITMQAFLFGDGGVLALGANCFNMAFLMSFTGYYMHAGLSAGSPGRVRRYLAPAVAAYAALSLAALAVALELGVQPMIAHGINGEPLYAPYPLSVTLPAMMLPHLLILAPIEALGTALVVSYMFKHNEGGIYRPEERGLRPLWKFIIIMAVLSPIGLMAPGTPWGEWGRGEVLRLLGYVPRGMEEMGGWWKGLLPGYSLPGFEGGAGSIILYMLSAAAGSGAVVLIIFLWGRIWPRR